MKSVRLCAVVVVLLAGRVSADVTPEDIESYYLNGQRSAEKNIAKIESMLTEIEDAIKIAKKTNINPNNTLGIGDSPKGKMLFATTKKQAVDFQKELAKKLADHKKLIAEMPKWDDTPVLRFKDAKAGDVGVLCVPIKEIDVLNDYPDGMVVPVQTTQLFDDGPGKYNLYLESIGIKVRSSEILPQKYKFNKIVRIEAINVREATVYLFTPDESDQMAQECLDRIAKQAK